MPHNFFTTEEIRQMCSDTFHNQTVVDIRTGTQTFADGVPTKGWAWKETRLIDLDPFDYKEERLVVQVGNEKYAVDYRAYIDKDADVIVGNRLTSNSGTTELEILAINNYDDHKQLLLREVRN